MSETWEINISDEFQGWYEDIGEATQEKIRVAVAMLELGGPTLGRPTVDSISGSRVHNLKELRPAGTTIRILFAFDPRRQAILLIGADKGEHGFNEWYREAISQAEEIWERYLAELRKEGLIR